MKTLMIRFALIAGIFFGQMMPLKMALADSELTDNRLTAEWWQWALSIPTRDNPLLDPSGAKCMVGQRGAVWFLAGRFDGSTADRTCTVPAGANLFFPIVNSVNFNTPNVCGQDGNDLHVRDLRASSAAYVDKATSITATLDGRPISEFKRIKSIVFAIALPENNVFDTPCTGLGNVPAGIYSPAVDDGIYVMLEAPEKGKHQLHFRAKGSDGIIQDITYKLTVVPVKNDE